MLIHKENMIDIKKELGDKYPDHVVAFDVIFESSKRNEEKKSMDV